MEHPRTGSARRRLALAATTTVLLLGGAGCGGDDTPPPAPSPSATTTAAAPVATHVAFAKVSGKLPKAARAPLAHQVGAVVDRWWQAAYLGDYPRDAASFRRAFPGFTAGAAALARRQAGITTNRGLAAATSVVAVKRWVTLDVLAAKKRAVGVTAVSRLIFDATTAAGTQRYTVRARLSMTKAKGHWRVFAFDVAKQRGTVAAHRTKKPGTSGGKTGKSGQPRKKETHR